MTVQTAEPIEILLACVASVALYRAGVELWDSFWTWRTATTERRCEAVRKLAWMKVRTAGKDVGLCLLVLVLGASSVLTDAPLNPNPLRLYFQIGWNLVVLWTLVNTAVNGRDADRVADIIEEERRGRPSPIITPDAKP